MLASGSRTPRAALAALAIVTYPVESLAASPCATATVLTNDDFALPGPYAVGVSTFTFVDSSRPTAPNGTFAGAPARTLVTEVWYPATTTGRDTPVESSGGPYPVVIHSHGFLDNRIGEQYVVEHLVSHGYIVAAPDYPLSNGSAPGGATVTDVHNQPGDASYVIDQVLALYGADADADRIGASGLSLGGLTTHLLGFHAALRDARIRAAVVMAGPACMFTGRFFKTTTAARMILHGDSDLLVPFKQNAKRGMRGGKGRRHLVELEIGSHTGFSAFAPLLDPDVHYDAIGCTAIEGAIETDQGGFGGLGGKQFGVNTSPKRCPLPCQDGAPAFPAMPAERHHELTTISTLAFFEAYLRDDLEAVCFLGKPMDLENADVDTKVKGKL